MDLIIKNSFRAETRIIGLAAIIQCSGCAWYTTNLQVILPTPYYKGLFRICLLTFTEKCHIWESFRVEETFEGGEKVCFITVPPTDTQFNI